MTRRWQDLPTAEEDPQNRHQQQTLLEPERLDLLLAQADEGKNETMSEEELEAAKNELYEEKEVQKALKQLKKGDMVELLRRNKINQALVEERDGKLFLRNNYGESCLLIPPTGLELMHRVQTQLVKEYHDAPSAGHPGVAKTFELLTRRFVWPFAQQTVRRYVRNCKLCRTTKPITQAYSGLLMPLPIPEKPWQDMAMDFVVGLPASKSTVDRVSYTNILTVTDRPTKERHFIATSSLEAPHVARLFVKFVYSRHGPPRTMMIDRGTNWLSTFFKRFSALIGAKQKASSAFHPETDG